MKLRQSDLRDIGEANADACLDGVMGYEDPMDNYWSAYQNVGDTVEDYGGDGDDERVALGFFQSRLLKLGDPHDVDLWLQFPEPIPGMDFEVQRLDTRRGQGVTIASFQSLAAAEQWADKHLPARCRFSIQRGDQEWGNLGEGYFYQTYVKR